MSNTATPSTPATSTPASISAAKVEKKAAKALTPSLGEYLTAKLNEAKSQVGVYTSKLPPAMQEKVRNSAKHGLRVTSLHEAIADDDAHGQAMLISAKCAEAIETALRLANDLHAMRAKAVDKATAKHKARSVGLRIK